MTLPTQHIIRHLFRVESLEEVPRQQLEELVEEYPSFGVGRYLLSRKLQAESANDFGEKTQRTNLYFSNPFWLQWLLQDQVPSPATELPKAASVGLPEDVGVELPEEAGVEPPEEARVEVLEEAPEEVHVEVPGEVPGELPVETIPEETQETPLVTVEQWNAAGEADLPAEEVFAPVTDTTETTIDVPERHEEAPEEAGWIPPVTPEPPAGPSAADLLLQSIAAIQDQRQAQRQEAEPAPVHEETVPPMGIAGLALEQMEEVTEAPEAPAQEEPPPPVTAPPAPPIFEPYHTVDYFASLGIRLVQEENPSDKLGKQLKSFTDWLKVMRRLPQKNREIIPDIAAERQVLAIAAHSIESKEVVTEAMAEVLAKQGMREKATEMYRKLSLLEPEKSAYFAAKIEQLKII